MPGVAEKIDRVLDHCESINDRLARLEERDASTRTGLVDHSERLRALERFMVQTRFLGAIVASAAAALFSWTLGLFSPRTS